MILLKWAYEIMSFFVQIFHRSSRKFLCIGINIIKQKFYLFFFKLSRVISTFTLALEQSDTPQKENITGLKKRGWISWRVWKRSHNPSYIPSLTVGFVGLTYHHHHHHHPIQIINYIYLVSNKWINKRFKSFPPK